MYIVADIHICICIFVHMHFYMVCMFKHVKTTISWLYFMWNIWIHFSFVHFNWPVSPSPYSAIESVSLSTPGCFAEWADCCPALLLSNLNDKTISYFIKFLHCCEIVYNLRLWVFMESAFIRIVATSIRQFAIMHIVFATTIASYDTNNNKQ